MFEIEYPALGKNSFIKVIGVIAMQPLPAGTLNVEFQEIDGDEINDWFPEAEPKPTVALVFNEVHTALYYATFEVKPDGSKPFPLEAIGYLDANLGAVKWVASSLAHLVNYSAYKLNCEAMAITPDSFNTYVSKTRYLSHPVYDLEPITPLN